MTRKRKKHKRSHVKNYHSREELIHMNHRQMQRLTELEGNTARLPEEEAVFVALTALKEAERVYEEAEKAVPAK